jgi:hypothetical protein
VLIITSLEGKRKALNWANTPNMETTKLQLKVPKSFPLTASYSHDWIAEQVKVIFPNVSQFEVQDIKVEYLESSSEKTITAQCLLYR